MAVAQPPTWARRLPFYYGWLLVIGQFNAALINIGPWTFPLFAMGMEEDLGWSRSALFGSMTVRMLLGFVLMPFTSRLMDSQRWPRVIMFGSALIFGLTLIAVSRVTSLWEFYLVYGVIGGIGAAGASGGLYQALIPKWFIRKRGRATAYGSMGSAASALLSPIYVVLFIDLFGWRTTWVLMGIIMFIIVAPFTLLVRRAPEDIGLLPDGDKPEPDDPGEETPDGTTEQPSAPPQRRPRAADTEHSYTVREALRYRTTYLLILASIVTSQSTVGLGSTYFPYFIDVGVPERAAALAVSVYGGFAIAGRIIWGNLADKIHIRHLMLILCMATGLTLGLMIRVDTTLLAFVYTSLSGLTLGGYVAVNQLVWPNYYGRHHIGAIRGTFGVVSRWSTAGGPFLAAFIFDVWGDYDPAFFIMFIGWMLAVALFYFARPLKPRTPALGTAPAPQEGSTADR